MFGLWSPPDHPHVILDPWSLRLLEAGHALLAIARASLRCTLFLRLLLLGIWASSICFDGLLGLTWPAAGDSCFCNLWALPVPCPMVCVPSRFDFMDFSHYSVGLWSMHSVGRLGMPIHLMCGVTETSVFATKRPQLCSFWHRDWDVFFLSFDATLGFPGEGPAPLWSLLSCNIGSMNTNLTWKVREETVLCLQETRVGRNNVRTTRKTVEAVGKGFFPGTLLDGLLQKNGKTRVSHGGVAVVAPPQTTLPFESASDVTGTYPRLLATKRVHAVWSQVTPRMRVLIVNIYARTSASSNEAILQENNQLFEDIFALISQFGAIPVILCGDFQEHPMNYPAIANAVLFHKWFDPLATVASDGLPNRPLTFSRDCTFTGLGDGCSTIDAVLLNETAFIALKSMEVLPFYEHQHRPIKAVFNWDAIFQHGFVYVKPASFDFTNLPSGQKGQQTLEHHAKALWDSKFESLLHHASTSEQKWEHANQFVVDVFLSSGGQWGPGPQKRAEPPTFKRQVFCPGQLPNFSAATTAANKMKKALNCLWELRTRLERAHGSDEDVHVTRRTAIKCWWKLHALHSPHLWLVQAFPTLVDLSICITWLTNELRTLESRKKHFRIAVWKHKIQQAAIGTKAYIFEHLKNKAIDDPPNLVTDCQGNIVCQPTDAILEINHQWDDIFAANVLQPDPMQVLAYVWPQIQSCHYDCNLPEITCDDLRDTIQARKKHAAPGLDGWKTNELQLLPAVAFMPFVRCFQHMEASHEPLPKALTCARQMILNKNGESTPLSKRLITVLPILLLSYTGARFRHLASWQSSHMPRQLLGAIKRGSMTSVHTELQLQVDFATHQAKPILGVKLDKAKCFDRVVPSLVIALFLAFGLPHYFANFVARMYEGIHRHMSYKGWSTPTATTAANGIPQGCSLSLLAMNMYMFVWIKLLEHLPNVVARAFVDDAYLWCSLQHAHELQTAVSITDLWDELSGQKTNPHKCTIWGSNSVARKRVKQMFPHMTLKNVFDVLGAWIRTTQKHDTGHSAAKTEKILLDAKNISVLPLAREVKATLLGMKVLPQCTFAVAHNQIPQNDLGKIQSQITTALWYPRPSWRSKWLVLGFLSKPFRVEPTLARAYACIRDFMRFFRDSPTTRDTCKDLLRSTQRHCYMHMVRDSFEIFGLCLTDDLEIAFKNSQRIALSNMTMRDIATCLQALSRDVCYQRACRTNRKDIKPSNGVLDYDLTCTYYRFSKQSFEGGPPAHTHFEAQLVGCSITNDRLAASKLSSSSDCRLCGETKETLSHLVDECPGLAEQRLSLPDHEFGENFRQLGIFEHPPKVIEHRLQWSNPDSIGVQPLQSFTKQSLWTDGSVLWGSVFWLTVGGFSVINEQGQCLKKGPVYSWALASYTTELWAVLEAIALAVSPIELFTDCKTVVNHFRALLTNRLIHPNWPHQSWWTFIWKTLLQKGHNDVSWFQICWIPAHTFEHLPAQCIPIELAQKRQTTPKHIHLNRIADHSAKQAAKDAAIVDPTDEPMLRSAILARQNWLTLLHKRINVRTSFTGPEEPCELAPQPDPDFETLLQERFSRWHWNAAPNTFDWKPKIPRNLENSSQLSLLETCWDSLCLFADNLRWKLCDDHLTSYAELAVLYFARDFTQSIFDPDTTTIRDLIKVVRKFFNIVGKIENVSLHPGVQTNLTKSANRTFPTGAIKGGILYMTNQELGILGNLCIEGAGQTLTSWQFFLRDVAT